VGGGSLRTQTNDVGGGQHTDRHDGEGVGNIQDTSTDEDNREHHDQCPVAILSGGHMQYAVVADDSEGESENSIGVCATEDCEKHSSDEQQCTPHCPLFTMQGLSCARIALIAHKPIDTVNHSHPNRISMASEAERKVRGGDRMQPSWGGQCMVPDWGS
jgi:hypothetical protein